MEKRKTGDFLAAKVEKAVKNAKHIMLFWESKLIHKLRGKTAVPNLHFVGDEKTATAEQIKLAFDYYPVLQADQEEQSSLEGSQKSEVEGSDLVHS